MSTSKFEIIHASPFKVALRNLLLTKLTTDISWDDLRSLTQDALDSAEFCPEWNEATGADLHEITDMVCEILYDSFTDEEAFPDFPEE